MGIRPVPAEFPVTQSFHANLTQYNVGAAHGAMDFGVPVGTEVVASAPGVVLFADWVWNLSPLSWEARWFQIRPAFGDTRTGGGILVVLDHGGYVTVSAHLNVTHLNAGDRVAQGQVIGESGNTGSSTGPHLHFALLPKPFQYGNGFFGGVDPAPYIRDPYFKLNPYTAPDFSGATMDGIDVASYQAGIDLSRVPADFVIVKATEGTGYVNPDMARAVEQALALGKRVGLYHFATATADSDAEADHFLRVAGPYLNRGAIPVLDWEPIGLDTYLEWAEDWCRRVEKARGVDPEQLLVYMNLSVSGYGWSPYMRRHPLWLAYYGQDVAFTGYGASFKPPQTPGWDLALWQYSQKGTLPGYNGLLDLNVAFGDPWNRPTGVGTATKSTGDWFDMATKADLQAVIREELQHAKFGDSTLGKYLTWHLGQIRSGIDGLPAAVLDGDTTLKGAYNGKPSKLRTTLEWFNHERDRDRGQVAALRSEVAGLNAKLDKVLTALQSKPSPTIADVLKETA